MTDLIKREDAHNLMRSLTRWCVRSEDGKFNNVGLLYDDVMFGIDKLPSVEQDRPIGHWEHYEPLPSEWGYKCSICGNPERSNGHKYCCNCGAKMK